MGFPTCPVLFSMFGAAYIAIYQAILQQRRHWEMLYTIYAFTVRNILLHTYVINRFPTLGFFKLLICICPFFCPAQVHSKCWCHIWFCVAQFFLQCYSLGCVLLRVTGIQGNEQRLWIHCYSFDLAGSCLFVCAIWKCRKELFEGGAGQILSKWTKTCSSVKCSMYVQSEFVKMITNHEKRFFWRHMKLKIDVKTPFFVINY